MKIVHMCLGCFFPDNYSYQENMLPKFHKQLGYDVEVIASLVTFDKDGKGTFLEKGSVYYNEHNIKVNRLDYKKPIKVYRKLKRYKKTYDVLEKSAPDILFIHGCQFMDMEVVVRYLKKHPNIIVYVDNHADFSNSGTNFFSKYILHKGLWRYTAQLIEPYTTKFYGVLPARVDWLIDLYKLPREKCELLVMGADDDKLEEIRVLQSRELVREKYGITSEDFLIMTGGKIDIWKKQTLLLMKAVKCVPDKNVKLIVFGSVVPELKKEIEQLSDGNKIQYIGWIDSEKSYQIFAAADLVVFPGRHSVFWEQVAGMGIPMICKYWKGTTHVDIGGNVRFLKEDSVEEMQKAIEELIQDKSVYAKMQEAARGKGKKEFSYKEIAKRAIQL